MRKSRWSAITLAPLLALLAPVSAAAQDPAAKASAVQLFDEADKLMLAGNVAGACPKYAASMKLDPQLGALLHLADCYAKNGQIASAWGSFREAEDMARMRGDDRAQLAHEQAASLAPRLSRITISVAPEATLSGLEVRLDGSPITQGAWGTATPIDPGSHGIEARAPGYDAWSSSIDVTGEAQQVRVEVPLLTAKREQAPAAAPASPIEVRVDDPPPIRTLGWVSTGVGVVALGLGGVFLVQRSNKLDERTKTCPVLDAEHCSDTDEKTYNSLGREADTNGTLATAGFIAGGALVVGGVLAIVLAPKPKTRTSAWLLPAVTNHSGGFVGGMQW